MKTLLGRGARGQSLLNSDYCQPPLIKFRAISSTPAPSPPSASSDQEKMKCRRKSNLIYLFGAAKAKSDAKWEQKSKTIQFSKCQTWAEAALAISLTLFISVSVYSRIFHFLPRRSWPAPSEFFVFGVWRWLKLRCLNRCLSPPMPSPPTPACSLSPSRDNQLPISEIPLLISF